MSCNRVRPLRHQRADHQAERLAPLLGCSFLAFLIWCGANAAHASAAALAPAQCVALARAPEPATSEGVREQINQMLAALAECQNSAELLAALGHGFNRLGDPVEALGHLERAVMLDPTPPGARLDYAMALAQTGEVQAAVTLVDEILEQPDVPPLLLPDLQRQRAAWVNGQWAGRSVIGLRLGRESNLLGSPGLTNLTVTLPDLAFQLPLDPSFQNQPGNYYAASFQTEWQRVALNGSYWELTGGLRRRDSPTTPLARTEQVDLAMERGINFSTTGAVPGNAARRADFNGVYLAAGASNFNTGTNVRYRLVGGTIGWLQQAPTGCRQRVGLEFQQRRYLNSTLLDGNYHGLAAQWVCDQSSGVQWQLGARWGQDRVSEPDRPGGDQQQRSVRGSAYLPVRSSLLVLGLQPETASWASGALLLDAELSWQKDEAAFSPLLGNGAVRSTRRTQLRLEYQHPLSRQWQLQVGWETIRQRSNLDLFLLRNRGLYLSVRYGF